jgi:hypothetical protein
MLGHLSLGSLDGSVDQDDAVRSVDFPFEILDAVARNGCFKSKSLYRMI